MTGTIGIIGSGEVAQAIAKHALRAGYSVLLSNSRGPESLTEIVASLGDRASAVTVAEAVDADLIVVGNKGMHGAARVLGSVPNKVAHKASCNVLIARTA